MCSENLIETRKLTHEEIDKILKASEAVNNFIPDLKAINVMLRQHSKAIDEEKTERIKEDDDIKHNYIKRFNKIDNGITVVNTKITNIKNNHNDLKVKLESKIAEAFKGQIGFLKKILFALLGCTLFLFISMVWDKIIDFISKIF
jgi:hypothetical protein